MPEKEIRTYDVELRVEEHEGGMPKITGYPAVFDSLSEDLGGFKEKIRRGAFSETIEKDDIRALFNHDPNYVLGRSTNGSLKLKETDKGLHFETEPPDTQWARDLITSIKRGDVNQGSFAFEVRAPEDEHWEKSEGGLIRELRKVRLRDVSVVTYPAYQATQINARTLEEKQKELDGDGAKPSTFDLRLKELQLREKE